MKPTIIDSIDNVFQFGKHKGQSIKQVALIDPDYIEWLCKTVIDFHITEEFIDSLSNYCLSIFFDNPDAYLNEKGDFTLTSWQHLKYGNKEVTIGIKNTQQRIELLKRNNSVPHLLDTFARKVFNGEACKVNLREKNHRINPPREQETSHDDYVTSHDDDYLISDEELRGMYNDAYEIDSNEFDGWHEPID